MNSPLDTVTPETSAVYLFSEALGYLRAAALRSVAVLGIADRLGDDARPVEQLAEETGADVEFLRRVLRLLVKRGIFHEDAEGRFALAPLGQALRTDSRSSAAWGIRMVTMNHAWHSAFDLVECVRSGRSAAETLFDRSYFQFIEGDRAEADLFHRGMASLSAAARRLALESYRFPETGVVVDVGGATGGFLRDILLTSPGLRGVLFDRDHVVPGAVPEGVGADRWSEVAGDFFESVPSGGDVYVLCYVLHDWNDEDCVRILRTVRAAMETGARLAVFESVVLPERDADDVQMMDVMMLMMQSGRERTADEFGVLFEKSGFRLERVVPAQGVLAVVEAVAV
ncbi:methyltransferase [Lentzea sp. NPDC058436]|uniref:methyltransferase n=1 Tax=Lentzea sp. NPDC058436 TaxID=3346499 RepID=UPI00364BD564